MVNYPLTFNAAILEDFNTPLAVDKVVFEGPLKIGQVLVKIHYSGICGKQLEEIRGPDPYLPHLMGHEGSGIVADIGPGVSTVKIGDPVILHWMKSNGIDSETPIYSRRGAAVNAGRVTTFNEFGVVSENRVTPISGDTDLSVACLFGCAVLTGVGVILNDAKLGTNESIAVFGCGGVGLNAVQGAKMVGAFPIIAVDQNQNSLDLAKTLGATHTVNSREIAVVDQVRSITNGLGSEVAIVAAGVPSLIELAAEASSQHGRVFLVGVPPVGSQITLGALEIHRGKSIQGSTGGGSSPTRDIPAYLNLHKRGELKVQELIGNMVPLDEINEAIKYQVSGAAGRTVLKME